MPVAVAPDDGGPEVAARLQALEATLRAIELRLERIESAVATPRPIADLKRIETRVDLVAERISTLLGGPSLTELMDRLDELERNVSAAGSVPKRRRRTEPL